MGLIAVVPTVKALLSANPAELEQPESQTICRLEPVACVTVLVHVPDCVAGNVPPVPVTSHAVVFAVFPGCTVQLPLCVTANDPPFALTTHGEVPWKSCTN